MNLVNASLEINLLFTRWRVKNGFSSAGLPFRKFFQFYLAKSEESTNLILKSGNLPAPKSETVRAQFFTALKADLR